MRTAVAVGASLVLVMMTYLANVSGEDEITDREKRKQSKTESAKPHTAETEVLPRTAVTIFYRKGDTWPKEDPKSKGNLLDGIKENYTYMLSSAAECVNAETGKTVKLEHKPEGQVRQDLIPGNYVFTMDYAWSKFYHHNLTGRTVCGGKAKKEINIVPGKTTIMTVIWEEKGPIIDLPLVEAEQACDKKLYAKAIEIYDRISKEYPDTDMGKIAAEEVTRIRSDSKNMEQLAARETEKQCLSLLSMAKSYATNKMYDRARKNLQEIIDDYPKTKYAEQAREELQKLPRK